MNRRILIILMGIVVVIVLISGYAGSLNTNPAQAGGQDQGAANKAPQTVPGDSGFGAQGSPNNAPTGHVTLGNAAGHSIRQ